MVEISSSETDNHRFPRYHHAAHAVERHYFRDASDYVFACADWGCAVGIAAKNPALCFRHHCDHRSLHYATGDPYNLMLLALPMYALYELGILLCRLLPKTCREPDSAT